MVAYYPTLWPLIWEKIEISFAPQAQLPTADPQFVGILGSFLCFQTTQESRNQDFKFQVTKTKCSSPRTKIQVQGRKKANEIKYCQPTLKRGHVTHQKEAKSLTPRIIQREHHQVQQTSSTPHKHPLSPEWIHVITIVLGHPLTSEVGQDIQKWIIYQANLSYTKFAFKWDPMQFEENQHLQKYEETNGSISYLKSNIIKQLMSLMIYMILLICQDRRAGQNYHPNHFHQG